jgi:hypothetical protein
MPLLRSSGGRSNRRLFMTKREICLHSLLSLLLLFLLPDGVAVPLRSPIVTTQDATICSLNACCCCCLVSNSGDVPLIKPLPESFSRRKALISRTLQNPPLPTRAPTTISVVQTILESNCLS